MAPDNRLAKMRLRGPHSQGPQVVVVPQARRWHAALCVIQVVGDNLAACWDLNPIPVRSFSTLSYYLSGTQRAHEPDGPDLRLRAPVSQAHPMRERSRP